MKTPNRQLSLWGPEEEDYGTPDRISPPFDPSHIRITSRLVLLQQLVSRIEHREIDLQPEFQRRPGLWGAVEKSRLIESLMILFPIPPFYLDATDDERWVVIDGLQRLSVFREFIVDKSLRLTGLEFLYHYEGCGWDDLPRSVQRRIGETELMVFQVERPTPPEVRYHLFRVLNTVGLPLSPQEIRHALNSGPAVSLLKELAESDLFQRATGNGIPKKRMADREGVLRVLAFLITPYAKYPGGEFDSFLDGAMKRINQMTEEERQDLVQRFKLGVDLAERLFGQHAFRKRVPNALRRQPLNKALLESWSVNLAVLPAAQQELLVQRREQVEAGFQALLSDPVFTAAISQGTGKKAMVQIRFEYIERLIQEVLAGDR